MWRLFVVFSMVHIAKSCAVYCQTAIPFVRPRVRHSLGLTALSRLVEKQPAAVLLGIVAVRCVVSSQLHQIHLLLSEDSGAVTESKSEEDSSKKELEAETEKPISAAMIASIGFYKQFISPLLPPACRFVPTCSQYGVQAIQTYGPAKGGVLTAWRLLRCSPIGGKGYDPPKWPPVPFWYSSY
jgi:putative membrane protein insertion efficiency factor